MMLVDKQKILASLLEDRLKFETKTHNDYIGRSFNDLPQFRVVLTDQELEDNLVPLEDAKSVLERMTKEKVIVFFNRVGSEWEIFVEVGIAREFSKHLYGLQFYFDTVTGQAEYAGIKIDFALGSYQYSLLKLLSSEPGRVFSHQEIVRIVYPTAEVSTVTKKNLNDLIREVKDKVEKRVGEKINIFENSGGYRLVISPK